MFISKQEKASILLRLHAMEKVVAQMLIAESESVKKSAGWTDEKRKKQSDRMKQFWASQREVESAK